MPRFERWSRSLTGSGGKAGEWGGFGFFGFFFGFPSFELLCSTIELLIPKARRPGGAVGVTPECPLSKDGTFKHMGARGRTESR